MCRECGEYCCGPRVNGEAGVYRYACWFASYLHVGMGRGAEVALWVVMVLVVAGVVVGVRLGVMPVGVGMGVEIVEGLLGLLARCMS